MNTPKVILTIPADFQAFCNRIGATFGSCQENGGLQVQIWTGTFTGATTSNTPGAFWVFCENIGARFDSISFDGTTWTAVFQTGSNPKA